MDIKGKQELPLKSWRGDFYLLATVSWKYVNQIPLPDIPVCNSRTNSWNEAGLISRGQLSPLNQGLCRLGSLSANYGKFSEGFGAGRKKVLTKNLSFPVYFETFNRFSVSIRPLTCKLPQAHPTESLQGFAALT